MLLIYYLKHNWFEKGPLQKTYSEKDYCKGRETDRKY